VSDLRIALLADYAEEGWPSMDLAASALAAELARLPSVSVETVRPAFARRATLISSGPRARNVDRFLNRFLDYPRRARRLEATVFHVVDHSYAHLVHTLPAARTGVLCHDLDAFRSLLEPEREPRPRWYRAMARRTLEGLQKAAVVFHTTEAVRAEILRLGVVEPSRLVRAPNGVAPELVPASVPREGFILHVGSCIPRKRIDVLLAVVARLGRPLVQVGGEWTSRDRELLARIATPVEQRRGIPPGELASLYQRAALVLQPSDREGFGLPVAEALACGAPVLASDIPALREVGGEAASYAPPGDIEAFVARGRELLEDPSRAPPLEARLAQARKFSWAEQARIVAEAYKRLAP
jgi:glycosyltransferase involved in cell wall biosynthesis